MVAKGEEEEVGWMGSLGLIDNKVLNLEWISNGALLYSTKNCVQSLGLEHDERQYEKKECAYSGSLFCIAEFEGTL